MDRDAQWPTGRLLSAVARRIERDWNAHLAAWDLNHASVAVLFLLLGGPRSQRELASASAVTEQTMSRIVARLERSGYVARKAHASDARRHQVTLTEAGRSAVVSAGDPRVAEEMGTRGLDADQVLRLREILVAMLAARPHETDPVDYPALPADDAGEVDQVACPHGPGPARPRTALRAVRRGLADPA